ncbi:MBL fold metallo-hydrolase [Halorhabdus sp. CBA1104]|uniref:MBL fold metallo-hydrolase n=1 Tax=unclassified Halorhabdus TaxID=2621901 RepID=UPI0012B2B0B4|nr:MULTISPECIES: MBL fold metallo-hydrolase [unclassified Halorhabdus]QGN06694.1 MBL fold metallo-hydrolase [Halorhabdus sp. CBA1104]
MRLRFLGTGSAMATGERNQTGLLFETADSRMLLDCGSGVLGGLAATDGGYTDLDAVLLTHHHLDHVADLLPLLKARWLADAPPLTIAGPRGTRELVDDLLSVHAYLDDHVDPTVTDLDPGAGTIGGFDIRARGGKHSMPGFGYRVTPANSDGPTAVFSGDTVAFPEFLSVADGADALVHDCSFPDDVETDNHPTPASLGAALATADIDVGAVYLTHLYPHTDGRHGEMLDSIADSYDGEVRIAADGLEVTL